MDHSTSLPSQFSATRQIGLHAYQQVLLIITMSCFAYAANWADPGIFAHVDFFDVLVMSDFALVN